MTIPSGIGQMGTFASHTAVSAWAIANNFLIVIVLVIALYLFAQYIGRGPFVALLVSLYAAYAPFAIFPYMSLLPTEPVMTSFLTHAGVYLGMVFIFFIILKRAVSSDFLSISGFGLLVLAFLGTAFLIALASHVFLIDSVYHLTPAISALFSPDKYFFWWFSGPALGLLFFAR